MTKPLLETTRNGYLAASSASAYSLVSMVSRFGPIINPGTILLVIASYVVCIMFLPLVLPVAPGGSVISLTYVASEKVIPGYGGGMSSAKAALESDTRTLGKDFAMTSIEFA